MKKQFVLTCVLGSFVAAATAFANSGQEDRNTTTVRPNQNQVGKLDNKTSGNAIRASKMMGKNIQNPSGESVGEIKDIVIDANTGRVRYAAVTYGGLLGIGNKMFAVPFEAFECRVDPDDRDDHILVLNVTKQSLEGDSGFDEDHWPNFADRKFTSDLDRRYGVERPVRNRERSVGVKVDRNGVDVDIDPKPNRND